MLRHGVPVEARRRNPIQLGRVQSIYLLPSSTQKKNKKKK
jgi:hypothetical protein